MNITPQPPDATGSPDIADLAQLSSAELLGAVLNALDYGVLLLSAQAWLCAANRLGIQRCLGQEALLLRSGTVVGRDCDITHRLHSAVANAARGRRSMLTLDLADAKTMAIAVLPLQGTVTPPRELLESLHQPAVLLLCSRPKLCEPLTMEFYARSCSLTVAETAVLRALMDGAAPAEVAEQTGVDISTVRTHISRLRAKAGAKTIRELLQQVSVLPPIVGLLAQPTHEMAEAARLC